MGFDDIDFYKAKEAGISDTQLYRQAGNSIVVNVLQNIFKNLSNVIGWKNLKSILQLKYKLRG